MKTERMHTEGADLGGGPAPETGAASTQPEDLQAVEAGLKKAIEDFQNRPKSEEMVEFSPKAAQGVEEAFRLQEWAKDEHSLVRAPIDTNVAPNTPEAARAIREAREEIYDAKLARMKDEGVVVAEPASDFEMRETSPEELIGRAMTKEELYQALEAIPEISGSQETLSGTEWKERLMLAEKTGAKDLGFITNTYGLRAKAEEVLLGKLPGWADVQTAPEQAPAAEAEDREPFDTPDEEAGKDRKAQAIADALNPDTAQGKSLLDKFSEDLASVAGGALQGAKSAGRKIASVFPDGYGASVEKKPAARKNTWWDNLMDWMQKNSGGK